MPRLNLAPGRLAAPSRSSRLGRWLGAFAIAGLCALSAPASAQTITVEIAPPAAKVETRPAAPGKNMVWAPGHWTRDQGQWVWVSGAWVKAHPKHRHYVGARWVKGPKGWVFHAGGYSARPGGKVAVVHHRPYHRAKAAAHTKRANKLQRQSNRADARSDKLDRRADRLDAKGHHRAADKAERKADRLENRSDRKQKKANRQKRKAKHQRKKARR